jgi:hypothetical protein
MALQWRDAVPGVRETKNEEQGTKNNERPRLKRRERPARAVSRQ